MGHSSHSRLTPHQSAGSNQMPLDLCPTSSSSGAVGSAIVIIGTQAWTSCARFDSPLTLPPYPARCPAWGVLRPSPGRWVQTAPRPPGLPQEPGWAPQFQHTPPTLSIQPSITSPATDPVEPEHRYHTLKTFQALFQPAFPDFRAHLFHTPNLAGAMPGSSHVKELLL